MARNSGIKKEGNRLNIITSCISTTMMLILLGAVVFFVCFAQSFSRSLQENFVLTLVLDDAAEATQVNALKKSVAQLPCTRQVAYVSKEEAIKEEAEALGADPAEFLGYNPLPASFDVTLKAEYANTDSLKRITPALEANPCVVEVIAPQDLMDDLDHNIRRVSTILLAVALLLMVVSFVLINNTIQMAVHSHRFRIKTLRLVGASYGFIRKPFVVKAICIGVVSGAVALVVLAAGVAYLMQCEPDIFELVTWQTIAATAGAVILSGLLITWLSAHVSVNRYLNKRAADIYRT